jgi:hypothetical protein
MCDKIKILAHALEDVSGMVVITGSRCGFTKKRTMIERVAKLAANGSLSVGEQTGIQFLVAVLVFTNMLQKSEKVSAQNSEILQIQSGANVTKRSD